jgi:pyridoxal phosphate enzyme (YggS family)
VTCVGATVPEKPPPVTPEAVAGRLAALRRRIERAGGADVAVVAVTKGFGPDAIDAAVAAGCDKIGENYSQELIEKLTLIRGPHPEIHFIGRVQSRKVKVLADVVDVWQSIDRGVLVDELAERRPAASLMIQVNVSDEPQKGGCPPVDAPSLVAQARSRGLDVVGLMTIGRTGPPEVARDGFRRLRGLADDLGVRHCSMGMSEDLDVAVSEGSTMVRVGTALFGDRPPPTGPRK